MGIPDLLKKVLRPSGAAVDLRAEADYLKGKRAFIDTSGWLHKAIRRDAKSVVLEGKSSAAVAYVVNMVEGVLGLGAIPVLVLGRCEVVTHCLYVTRTMMQSA